MKKLIYSIFAAGLLLTTSSCEKILEKTPDGQITIDKVLTNHGSTQGLLDAAYGEIYLKRDGIAFVMEPMDAMTDNTFWAATYNAYNWHNGALSLSNPVIDDQWASPTEQLWPDFWRGIRLCNNVILYIPQAYDLGTITDLEKNKWVDEAIVLRAWYYMQLLEYYGPVPYITKPISVNDDFNAFVRPTYQELVDKLVADLDLVIANGNIPDRCAPAERMHVDRGVAMAIKARLLLDNASPLNNPTNDTKKWEAALDAANDIIALSAYDLVPKEQYKTLFNQAFANDNPEIIWRSWYNNQENNTHNAVDVGEYVHASISHVWNCGESPTQELVDCFELTNGSLPVTYNDDTHLNVTVTEGAAEMGYSEEKGGEPYANRDMRFYNNIVYNECNYGIPYNCTVPYIVLTYVGGPNGYNDVISQETQRSCTGYYQRKDTDITVFAPNGAYGPCEPNYWVFFRLAEFYLNAAECYCELGDNESALEMLNVVRNRAGQPDLEDVKEFEYTKEFILGRIRNERRVEFCMEGMRFNDQRRWKILDQTNRFVTGMRITKEGETEQYLEDGYYKKGIYSYERRKIRDYQSYTDKYLVMPIPLEDAKKMPNMTQPEAWR